MVQGIEFNHAMNTHSLQGAMATLSVLFRSQTPPSLLDVGEPARDTQRRTFTAATAGLSLALLLPAQAQFWDFGRPRRRARRVRG